MARRLKSEVATRVVCHLQGEDTFLDGLPDSHRDAAWQLLQEKCADVDLFITPSRYFADLMISRLNLPPGRVRVIYNGINLDGLEIRKPKSETRTRTVPFLGYFARRCQQKGLDTLVEAYIHLKNRGKVPRLKLHIGGSCGPADEPFVMELRRRLAKAGYIGEVGFFPNLSRAEKLDFLGWLSVFSVPAGYGEARAAARATRTGGRAGRLTPRQADVRIDSQMPLAEKLALADYVIDNRGTREETEQSAREVFAKLREEAREAGR